MDFNLGIPKKICWREHMIKGIIHTGICTLPPEGLSLTELYDFFEQKDRYDVADMFWHIRNFLNWEASRLKYTHINERKETNRLDYSVERAPNGHSVWLVLKFGDQETLGRFKEMAPRTRFDSLKEVKE